MYTEKFAAKFAQFAPAAVLGKETTFENGHGVIIVTAAVTGAKFAAYRVSDAQCIAAAIAAGDMSKAAEIADSPAVKFAALHRSNMGTRSDCTSAKAKAEAAAAKAEAAAAKVAKLKAALAAAEAEAEAAEAEAKKAKEAAEAEAAEAAKKAEAAAKAKAEAEAKKAEAAKAREAKKAEAAAKAKAKEAEAVKKAAAAMGIDPAALAAFIAAQRAAK